MIEKTNILNYGFTPAMILENIQGTPSRVTAVHKGRYELICEYGLCFAKLKTSIYYNGEGATFPTTGDFVLIDYNARGDSQIIRTLSRKSFFSRSDPTTHGQSEQAVASNFDYVFILQSLNYDFNPRRMERYITLAWQSNAVPVLILTKADLVTDYDSHISEIKNIAAGVSIYVISAKTGFGIDLLDDYLKPYKTIAFLGSSGVGKSSLVNALAGEDIMTVNEIREDDSKGRHTTTHRQLIMLPSGAMIIDTPGMRELGMWDVSDGLGNAFNDVEQYFSLCRFSDCNHEAEPGCAIKTAIADGELSRERWENYLKIKHEAKYASKKERLLNDKTQGRSSAKFHKSNNRIKELN